MKKIHIILFLVLTLMTSALCQTWSEWGKGFDKTWSSFNDNGSIIGTVLSGVSTPYLDSMLVVLDNTDGNGTLTNYPNLVILNANNFGSGASKNYFSREDGTTFRFIRKTGRTNVPFWVQSYSVSGSSGRIWVKTSNTSASKDTLILFCNNGISAPDSSHLEVVFPAGDDFNNSTYSNLVQINDSATGLYAYGSSAHLAVNDTANQHNAKHRILKVSNLVYYPTDVTEPYKVMTSGVVTGNNTNTGTDSSQIYLWTATSRNQYPYTPSANPVISDKSGGDPAGCSDPYLVLVKGASSATDSLFCFFFYDSTGVANDGIYVVGTQASDGLTWTPKVRVLQNLTNPIRKPVVTFENGIWYLFYEYAIESSPTYYERCIGLATLTATTPFSTFTVYSDGDSPANKFITANTGASGALAADSNSVSPISISRNQSSGLIYLSYEGSSAGGSYAQGIGGIMVTTGSPITVADAIFTRLIPLQRSNSLISRPLFTFLDSCDVSTGLGGFAWQGNADSGAYRFDFISQIFNESYNELTSKGYYTYGRGQHITPVPQDSVYSLYRVTDSSGVRLFGANTNTYHPFRFSGGSGGLMTYNYPVTQDFEIVTEVKNQGWRVSSGADGTSIPTLFGFTIAVGDTPVIADSLSTDTKIYKQYVAQRDNTGMWYHTHLTGSNYFDINDTLATGTRKGDFRMGRTGFTTTCDTANGVDGYLYAGNVWATYKSLMDNYNIFSYRYPEIGTTFADDSVITVFMNGIAVAQTYDKLDAVQRARSKKFIGFGFNESTSGAGGVGAMKYWFVRPIQTNYREPQTYLVKYNPILADTTHYTVGQGTYDSSYVKDAYIVYWGASNAERTYNTGGSAAANNSLGYVNSTAIEESRGLLWFSNAMLPANFILDSAVIDLYLTAGNVGGTDADGNIFLISECLKDWVEGNKTTYAAGSMDRTMCSWTRRGSGTGVGGTTIASSDSNWFTNAANFSTADKEDFSHIWGISSSDTIKAVGTGRDNTHVTFNVTPITRKQLSTGINFGYVIRDISAKPTGTGNYYKRPDSRESATAGQRPTITYFGRLAS